LLSQMHKGFVEPEGRGAYEADLLNDVSEARFHRSPPVFSGGGPSIGGLRPAGATSFSNFGCSQPGRFPAPLALATGKADGRVQSTAQFANYSNKMIHLSRLHVAATAGRDARVTTAENRAIREIGPTW